jgi:acetylornithine aminotransferase
VLTLAKGLGGGLPIGACIGVGGCGTALGKGDHGSTFGGNPVAAQAALSVLDVIEDAGLIEHAGRMGELLRSRIAGLRHPAIRDVRGVGLLVGVELDEPECACAVVNALRRDGVLIGRTGPRGDVLKVRPPLVFAEPHAEVLLAALERALGPF